MTREERAREVVERLAVAYPEAQCELEFANPWELLVATVLSGQSTDQRVNRVMPELLRRWPGPEELAGAPRGKVEDVIRSTGLFRSKARSLVAMAARVVNEHGGEVPRQLDRLVDLPGVGPKTAKVVLGVAFGIPAGVAVDTHVRRVSRRLGLSGRDQAEKVAADLETLLPPEEWVKLSLRLVLHGRRVCTARTPRCGECGLEPVCDQVGVRRPTSEGTRDVEPGP